MKITGVEQKLIAWIEDHLLVLMVVFVTFCGLLIRYLLRPIATIDATDCFIPWYQEIKNGGGFLALQEQVGDYNILYQFLIAIMTYLPIYSLSAYKALFVMFDYALAVVSAGIVYELTSDRRGEKAAAAYTLVLLSPLVWLNSSAWGQCDSIYCFWILAAFLFLLRERFGLAFVLYGVAFAFKLQAIFALPFFLLYWFMKKRFTLLYFLVIPVVMMVSTIPTLVMGRKGGPFLCFLIYAGQTSTEIMYNQYPSFWALLSPPEPENYELYMSAGMIFSAAALILLAAVWIRKGVRPDSRNCIYMLFMLTYTCVITMPGMHERYGYVYEILGILIAVVNRRTRALLPFLLGTTLCTYGSYLFGMEINLTALAAVNCLVYLIYSVMLTGDICDTHCERINHS
ncbi:MAG: glycosyltransferase 87 family protein [Lachnospiraceae bacterium]|nr:glycosyltransferase 87 family protein [Lachnospiraceae bacterium]